MLLLLLLLLMPATFICLHVWQRGSSAQISPVIVNSRTTCCSSKMTDDSLSSAKSALNRLNVPPTPHKFDS